MWLNPRDGIPAMLSARAGRAVAMTSPCRGWELSTRNLKLWFLCRSSRTASASLLNTYLVYCGSLSSPRMRRDTQDISKQVVCCRCKSKGEYWRDMEAWTRGTVQARAHFYTYHGWSNMCSLGLRGLPSGVWEMESTRTRVFTASLLARAPSPLLTAASSARPCHSNSPPVHITTRKALFRS